MASKWLSQLEDKETTYLASKSPSLFDNVVFSPSPSLNYAIGGKGFVYGRAPLFYGVKSSGKSTEALAIIAEMQRVCPEGEAIYISTEYDPPGERATNIGVDQDRLLVRETNIPSKIFDWIDKDVGEMCRQGAPIKIIVIDTVGAIRGPKELNADSSEDFLIGDLSGYLPRGLNLIVDTIRKYKILTILIQQARQKSKQIGPKTITYYDFNGGEALKHFADYVILFEKVDKSGSVILDDTKVGPTGKSEQIGHRVKAKVEKNRLGPPFREAEFDIEYRKGHVNQHEEIANLGIGLGIIERPNNLIYQFGDQKWKGKDEFHLAVMNSLDLKTAIYQEILKRG